MCNGWKPILDFISSQLGFHKAAIELTEQLWLQNMIVGDETDYYTHRDFDRTNREYFYPWLRGLLQICHDQVEKNSFGQMLLCWDMDLYHPEEVDQTVVAPLERYTWNYLIEVGASGNRDICETILSVGQ